MSTVLLFSSFIGLFLSKIPVAIALAVSTILVLALQGDFSTYMIMQRMVASLTNPALMAIPGFIFAGALMGRGGVARALIDAANSWIGHIRGGMAVVTIVVCMIFAAISGSSPATAAAVGAMVIPGMVKSGYSKKYAMGLVAAAGTLGILIPPSIPMILYGITAEESIGKLFAAGIVPGIIMGLLLIAFAIFYARKHNYSGGRKYSWAERRQLSFKALPGLFMPVLILGTIYTGIATPTESAVIAALYTIVVSKFVYKELQKGDWSLILKETVSTTSMIFLILAAANVFALYLANERIPMTVAEWVGNYNLTVFMFFVLTQIMFFVMGAFLEAASIILITLPILLPIMKNLGIDPIHFAIVMTVNMELAQITPPVGLNLFVVSGVAKEPVEQVIKGVLPFILIMIFGLILFAVFPQLSLFLTEYM